MKIKLFIFTMWLGAALTACVEQTPLPSPNLMVLATEAQAEAQDGMVDASFLAVSDAKNCEERVAAAKAVFPGAKIVYVAHYCAYSDIKFEPFGHEPEPTGTAYYFDLQFSKDGKVLKSLTAHDSNAACEKTKKGVCVISYQNVLTKIL